MELEIPTPHETNKLPKIWSIHTEDLVDCKNFLNDECVCGVCNNRLMSTMIADNKS